MITNKELIQDYLDKNGHILKLNEVLLINPWYEVKSLKDLVYAKNVFKEFWSDETSFSYNEHYKEDMIYYHGNDMILDYSFKNELLKSDIQTTIDEYERIHKIYNHNINSEHYLEWVNTHTTSLSNMYEYLENSEIEVIKKLFDEYYDYDILDLKLWEDVLKINMNQIDQYYLDLENDRLVNEKELLYTIRKEKQNAR